MREVKFVDKNTGSMIGYVYVVECEGHYKIGKTLTCTTRFYEYTKLFSEPKLIFCELVNDYDEIEKNLHKMFQKNRTRGEWFDLLESDLSVIENYLIKNKAKGEIGFKTKLAKIKKPCKKQSVNKNQEPETEEIVKITGDYINVLVDNEDKVIDILRNNPAIYVAFSSMKRYLEVNENILIKNGKKYKTIDLAEELGVSRQTASMYIKKLKQLNLLAELDNGRKGKFLVINPYIYLSGDSVPLKILKLFDK